MTAGLRMDAATLLQEHSWRVAVLVGLVAWSAYHTIASFSPTSNADVSSASVVLLMIKRILWSGLSLLLLNWLRIEMNTILLRAKLPKGDLGYPLVGTFLDAVTTQQGQYWPNKKKKYGTLFSENGFTLNTTTCSKEGISWLWNIERKGATQTAWPPTIAALTGAGSVNNANGKHHRALRRILEPAFATNATRDYLQAIDQLTQKILKEWSDMDQYHSSQVFKSFALRLFFVAAFGQEIEEAVLQELTNDFTIWLQGFTAVIPLRIPGLRFAKCMNAKDRMHRLVEKMVLKFKEENPPGSERAQKTMMGRACYGLDEEGQPMPMPELKDNILTMIFAGHDTTYASVGTAFHYLCVNPKIRKALAKEVRAFKEPLDFDELKSAPILNAFIAESWRRDPPIAVGMRQLKQEFTYEGFWFPKGLVIQYSILLATRNEELYPRPTEFDISRFLPKDHPLISDPALQTAAKNVDPNALKASYPIFGGSTHSCLGHYFAKLEMRSLLTRLLRTYDLQERNAEKVFFPINGWKNEFKLLLLKA